MSRPSPGSRFEDKRVFLVAAGLNEALPHTGALLKSRAPRAPPPTYQARRKPVPIFVGSFPLPPTPPPPPSSASALAPAQAPQRKAMSFSSQIAIESEGILEGQRSDSSVPSHAGASI